MPEKIILYGSPLSQPSRAVEWFCKLNNIEYEFKNQNPRKGDLRTEEYVKMNPNKKMPVIDDNGFYVFESHAILRYLSQKYKTAPHWYPTDTKERAKVDMYLDWHHSNIRIGAAHLVFFTVFANSPMNFDDEEETKKILKKSLKFIERNFLKGMKYIGDLNEPSIADLSLYGELSSLKLIQYDFAHYTNIKKWMKKMEKLPKHEEVHSVIHKVAKKRSKL
eukprot:gene1312-11395_t